VCAEMDHAIKNAVHSDQRATISYMTHLLTLEARRVGREPAAFTFCQKAPWPMKAPQLPTFMLVLLDLLTNRQGLDRSNVANDLVQLRAGRQDEQSCKSWAYSDGQV